LNKTIKIIVVFLMMIFSKIGGDHFKLSVHTLCGFSFYCVWHDTNHVEILSTMFGMAAAQSCIICAGTCLLTSKIIWIMDTSCDLNTNNIIHEFMNYMSGFQIFVEGESKEKKEPSSVCIVLQIVFSKFGKSPWEHYISKNSFIYEIIYYTFKVVTIKFS